MWGEYDDDTLRNVFCACLASAVNDARPVPPCQPLTAETIQAVDAVADAMRRNPTIDIRGLQQLVDDAWAEFGHQLDGTHYEAARTRWAEDRRRRSASCVITRARIDAWLKPIDPSLIDFGD